jgi:hypothetical protein
MFGILAMRSFRAPQEQTLAPAMPQTDRVDLQLLGKRSARKRVAGGESPYRAGDKRLTATSGK